MAMTASAAIVVIVIAVTVVFVIATTVAVVTAATTATSHVSYKMFNLFCCGFTILDDCTFEGQVFACQRMVQVNLHLFFTHLDNTAVETVSFLVLKRNDSILVDMLVVEMTVDAEHLALQIEYQVVPVVAISLIVGNGEVKTVTFLQTSNLLFEGVEGYSETCNKLERALLGGLFRHLLAILSVNKQLVGHFHVLILFLHIFLTVFFFRLQK